MKGLRPAIGAIVGGAAILLGEPVSLDAQEPHLQLKDGFVEVEEGTIHYTIGGNGPPLLLIHGFAFAGQLWNQFVDAFGEHYTLIIPDLPGHGRSSDVEGPWSYAQVARDMFRVLDHLGHQRAAGIGYSAGGNTLIHMATQQPERLSSMVLVAGGHRIPTDAREAIRNIRFEDMPPNQQHDIRVSHLRGDTQILKIYELLRGLADNFDDFDFTPEHLARVPVRTLLVWGDEDPYYPMNLVMELHASLPNASLWVLPGEGHGFLGTEAFGGSRVAAGAFAPTVLRFLLNPNAN
jgi:pimeloyl-ACP methyl ester carboxylesterase